MKLAVNLKEAGYQVALVEAMPQILRTYDHDMAQIIQKELLDHGADLVVGEQAVAFEQSGYYLKFREKDRGRRHSGTVDDLRDLELCYAPPFSTPKAPEILPDLWRATF